MKLKINYINGQAAEVYRKREKPFDWKTGDSGIDLSYVGPDTIIRPGEVAVLKTGVRCQIADADSDCYEVQIRGRSGLAGRGIFAHFGTTDYSYTGENAVILANLGKEDFAVRQGDRIGQIVVVAIAKPELSVVDALDETDRGAKGFGSSGV
jgi:dUTP pyrophosphatase